MNEYRTNTGYRTLINVSLLNGVGNSLFNIVFVIYASTLPFRELAVSLASIATFIPSILEIVVSYFSDQTRQKTRNFMLARLLQGLLFVGLALLIKAPASMLVFLLLLAINIISDCLGSYGGGLAMPFYKRLIPDTELEAAMGFQTSSNTLVQMIFQGVGAWLIVVLNHNFSMFGLLNALTFFIATALFFKNRNIFYQQEKDLAITKVAKQVESQDFKTSLKTTLKLLASNQFLKYVMVFALIINAIAGSLSGLMNIALLNLHGMWFGNFGNTIAAGNILLSVGIIAGSLLTKDIFHRLRTMSLITLIFICIASHGVNFLFVQNRWFLIVSMFVMGYLMGKINPRLSAFMMREIPEERLAVTAGVFSTMVMLGGPIAQVILLGIANWQTVGLSWWLVLLLSSSFGLISVLLNKKVTEPQLPEKA